MRYQTTYSPGNFAAVDFDVAHNALFTLAAASFNYYNLASLELVMAQPLTNNANYLHATSNYVFIGWIDGSRTLFQRLSNPALGSNTNQPPVAGFVRTPTNATTLTSITFDASSSSDDQGGDALQYRWDWDNDGVYDTLFTNQSVTTHHYNFAGTKTATLQVKDRYGATSVTAQTFNVIQQNDPGQPGGANPLFEVQFPAADVAFDPVRPYAYLSGYAEKELVVLNLTNGLIERVFNFDWNPESITVAPNGQMMYVALLRRPHSPYWFGGHTNYIAEFDLSQQAKIKEFEILADPYGLAVTDSGILVVPGGSDQWTDIRTYRTSTGELLGTAFIREMSRIFLHPSQRAVYTADTDSSPSDIQRFTFDPVSGVFLASWDSPYHGDYPMNGNVWCLPSGTSVLVRGGSIFSSSPNQAQDMRYQSTLASGGVDDATFDPPHNAFFTVGPSGAQTWLRQYDAQTYQLTSSTEVTNGTRFVSARNRDLYVAWTTAAETVFQRLQNPALPDAFIVQSPQSQSVLAGSTTTLLVSVRGQPPFSTQWFFQGGALAGQTNQSLILNNVQSLQEGDYYVSVSNAFASVTSAVAHLTVLVPPSIVRQPQSMQPYAGQTVTFDILAAGSPLLSYQWAFEGAAIPGATNASFSITNVQLSNVGAYQVVVSNAVGIVLSVPAGLRVLPAAPTVVIDPFTQSLRAGSDVQFSVAYSGSAPTYVHWWFNGVPLPGATGSSLVITNIQPANSGAYSAWLSNSISQTSSTTATLTVLPSPPWMFIEPLSVSISAGSDVLLRAAARGSIPLSYQWRKDGADLTNFSNPTLLLSNSNPGQSGGYSLLVSNLYGMVTSSIASVVITGVAPAFVQQPMDANVNVGGRLSLITAAMGTDPLSFAWWFNGAPLLGQTGPALTLSNAQATATGQYFVIASNQFGLATSVTATVTILMPPQILVALSNQVAVSGANVRLGVEVQGASPLSYSWYHNGLPIAAATNSVLWLTNVQPAQSGVYRLVANNRFGSDSSLMSLWISQPPGAVVTWGDDQAGQTNVPPKLGDVVQTAGGDFHSLALQPNGLVTAWGFSGSGQASPPAGLSNVVSIAAGAYHSLALTLEGKVIAWGYNSSGQATVTTGLTSAVSIAAGETHSAAVQQDGLVVVWGDNTLGQQNLPPGAGFVIAVAAGRNHTVGLRNNGTVIAWGLNSSGQATVPAGLIGVKAIAAGYLHSLALRADGSVLSWGDNTFGQTSVPPGLTDVVAIAAGDYHSYALRTNGTVVAWGDDHWGQLRLPTILHDVRFLGSGYYHGLSTVAPLVNWSKTGGVMVFSWAGSYSLEYAESTSGPFVSIPNTRSWTNLLQNPFGLFRLRRIP